MKALFHQTLQLLHYYKFRFALTLVSLVFGMSALITMSIVRHNVQLQIDGILGGQHENINIVQVIASSGAQDQLTASLGILGFSDWSGLMLPNCRLSPFIIAPYTLNIGAQHLSVVGVDADFFVHIGLAAAKGRLFGPWDRYRPVAVTGFEAAQALQTSGMKMDSWLGIEGHFFEEVGVLNQAQVNPLLDFDINRCVFIDVYRLAQINSQAVFMNFITTIEDSVSEHYLQDSFHAFVPAARVFVRSSHLMREKLEKSKQTLLKVLSSIAVITLGLGMVSMLNVWIILLQERKAEINLRRLLGARVTDIIAQFGLEALVLCSIGLLFSLVLGTGASYIVVNKLDMALTIHLKCFAVSIAFALTLGVFLGLLSGLYARFSVYIRQNQT